MVRATSIPKRATWARVVHLLAVHHPLVAVAHGFGGQAGHVGPCSRLAEHLAPHLLAGEQRSQVATLLGVRTVGVNGGRAHAVADRVAGKGLRCPCGAKTLLHHFLQIGGQPEAAEPLVEVDEGQAEVELGAQEGRGIGVLGWVLVEELCHKVDDVALPGWGFDDRISEGGHPANAT